MRGCCPPAPLAACPLLASPPGPEGRSLQYHSGPGRLQLPGSMQVSAQPSGNSALCMGQLQLRGTIVGRGGLRRKLSRVVAVFSSRFLFGRQCGHVETLNTHLHDFLKSAIAFRFPSCLFRLPLTYPMIKLRGTAIEKATFYSNRTKLAFQITSILSFAIVYYWFWRQ